MIFGEERKHSIWTERYRPDNLDTYVGNVQVVEKIKKYIEDKDIPHLLFYGKAGGGKTTLAKIIVNSIDCDYLYINASDERNIDLVRDKIKSFASSAGFKPLKVVVLDEADFLNPTSTQPALRNLMETFSLYCRFIMTANYVERIIEPLQSRCQAYNLAPPSKKDVALNMVNILRKENITFTPEDLGIVVNASYPDIRKILNTLQQYSINGNLVLDKATIVTSSYQLQLLEHLKTSDKKTAFTEIRKILSSSGQNTFVDLYQFLFDSIDDYAKGNIAGAILALAESQVQEASAIDKELHAMALFVNILNLIK
mgnify:CR=1 FL=1